MRPKRIIVGVSGGIAAYKACSVVRQLTEAGHDVHVVPTRAALRFVGAATFEALSGHSVRSDVFEDVSEVPHVRLGQQADLVLVAPATADLLARAATGRADDQKLAGLPRALHRAPTHRGRCGLLAAPPRRARAGRAAIRCARRGGGGHHRCSLCTACCCISSRCSSAWLMTI